jgi:hypothetical protein
MLPPLGALSLSAPAGVPTGGRDANSAPQRGASFLDGILKSQAGVTKVVNRARPGGKRADYASDGPVRRTINPDDDVCPDCPEGENRDLYIDRYDHVKKCNRCGLELGKFASEKAEKRNFADDDVDRSRTTEDNSDEMRRLNHIEPHELQMTSENDKGWWPIQNRLQQCYLWLNLMGDNPLTQDAKWWLRDDEIRRAKSLIRHACVHWSLTGKAERMSNPVLWAVIVALQMCAERYGSEGFVVPNDRPDLQQLLTIGGLHAFLREQRSDTHRTDEVEGTATQVRGANREAQRMLARQKYRDASFFELNTNGLMGRVGFLNNLLQQSGALPGGLSPVITGLNRPALRD